MFMNRVAMVVSDNRHGNMFLETNHHHDNRDNNKYSFHDNRDIGNHGDPFDASNYESVVSAQTDGNHNLLETLERKYLNEKLKSFLPFLRRKDCYGVQAAKERTDNRDQQTGFLIHEDPQPLFPETAEYQDIWAKRAKFPYGLWRNPLSAGLGRREMLRRTHEAYARDSYPMREGLRRPPLRTGQQKQQQQQQLQQQQKQQQQQSQHHYVCSWRKILTQYLLFGLLVFCSTCLMMRCYWPRFPWDHLIKLMNVAWEKDLIFCVQNATIFNPIP